MTTGSGSKRHFPRMGLKTIWTWLTVAMLLASIVPGLLNTAAAQDGDDTSSDQTQEQPADTTDQSTDQTTDTTEQTTDTVVETDQTTDDTTTDTQGQGLAPEVVEVGSIQAVVNSCSTGVTLPANDPATLTTCTVSPDAATFQLDGPAGSLGSQVTSGGGVLYSNLNPGAYTLSFLNPPPGAFDIFCEGFDSHGNTKPYARASFVAGSWSTTLDLLSGENITCNWFIPAPTMTTGGTGSVIIRKRACPVGYDASAHDMYEMAATCQDMPAAVPFSVFEAGGGYDGGVKPTSGPLNDVQFQNVPNVPLWIYEEVPDGFGDPVAFCSVDTNLGADVLPTTYYPWGPGYIELDAPGEGNVVQCDWYNIPTTGFSVTVYKWQCDPGTLYNQTDPDYYPTQCATEQPGIDFTLTDGNGTTPFTSDTNGRQLDGVVPDGSGKFTLTELDQDGYGDPVGFCQTLNGTPGTPATLVNGVLAVTVPAGLDDDYQCWFYNVPTNPFSVTVYKWQCEPGTLYNQTDPDYYPTQCATEQPGIDFTLTDGNGSTPFQSDTNGKQLDSVIADANGKFTLTETIPPGYGDPVGFCQTLNGTPGTSATLVDGVLTVMVPADLDDDYQCWFYNVPTTPGTVTVYKWECPQGMTVDPTYDAHKTACTQPMNNVNFTLTDSLGPRAMTTAGGMVQWTDVQIEPIAVTEDVPSGYTNQPFVFCAFDPQGGSPLTYSMVNNVLKATLDQGGQKIVCHWFNQYMGPGEVTIYKWTCPEGYDVHAWGADPKTDCTEATNGINFILDQPAPEVDLQTMTGDSIPGAVYFGGLTPGDYIVTEVVPAGIAQVFVLDCVGLNTGSVHPVPLSFGPTLAMKIAGGDKIRCDWYNVPAPNPEYGWMTVTKYNCSTPTYVSDIDCEVFEGGKTFNLQMWNGTAWGDSMSGTTNTAGQLTWINLNPGTYRVIEQGEKACKMTSTPADTNGNPVVNAKAGTMVKVYNCGKTPPPGGKMPTKYPNTGVNPEASTRVAPAASILGALGLLGTASVSRRTFLRRAAVAGAAIGGGSLVVASGFANQAIQPIGIADPDGTPEGTPGADCLYPATPSAATPPDGTPVACARGAVPIHISIEPIAVDANIEVLEIIDGEMQAPTGATDVAWYKESARLGEQGNILLAGHLNYWGVPEGVFFALAQLKEGDVVEIEGDDGEIYRYVVQWAQAFPSDENPPEEALGQTAEEVITMITCGGEWITDRAEYDHRTLVRAIRDSEYVPSTPVATPGA